MWHQLLQHSQQLGHWSTILQNKVNTVTDTLYASDKFRNDKFSYSIWHKSYDRNQHCISDTLLTTISQVRLSEWMRLGELVTKSYYVYIYIYICNYIDDLLQDGRNSIDNAL